MLETLAALLLATVLIVPITRRFGFGSVLGYLIDGVLIGPAGLRLITGVRQISTVSELGVVMLLFLIGLELRPLRLWTMRRSVFGLGTAHLVACAAALACLIHLSGLSWPGSIALGAGLALSSTAIVLPMLGERQLLGGRAGRDSFAVLLFQDLSFIPLVALLPLLADGTHGHGKLSLSATALPWRDVGLGLGAIAAIVVLGLLLLPRVFRLIGGARTPELFTATALLAVAGAAWIANIAGLSMSLGAFLAGVLLSSSEYRHELQSDIQPFEGLLLGFFFISVGMSARLELLVAHPASVLLDAMALLGVKIAIGWVLGRVSRQGQADAVRFALALPQGSEFSFVLFAAGVAAGILPHDIADRATLVIALSMAATPILFSLSERLVLPRLEQRREQVYDTIEADAPVIICGFGRMGQIVGRVLRTQGIAYTALDTDPTQIEVIRRFGSKVYYGDPARHEMLRLAGAETAKLLVVTLGDPDDLLRVVDMARHSFPELKIIARARNRKHAHLLMEREVDYVVRETFHSALRMTEEVLESLGLPTAQAEAIVETFRESDEQVLQETVIYRDDEKRLIQSAQALSAELTSLFQHDRPVASSAQEPTRKMPEPAAPSPNP